MIRQLPLVAFCAVAACAVPDYRPVRAPAPIPAPQPELPPQVNPQSAKERFLRAVEANGCEVNAGNSAAILAGATLSQQDLARILQELKDEGRGSVAPDGTGFRVNTGTCV